MFAGCIILGVPRKRQRRIKTHHGVNYAACLCRIASALEQKFRSKWKYLHSYLELAREQNPPVSPDVFDVAWYFALVQCISGTSGDWKLGLKWSGLIALTADRIMYWRLLHSLCKKGTMRFDFWYFLLGPRLSHMVRSPPPITILLTSLVAEQKDFQEDLVLFWPFASKVNP